MPDVDALRLAFLNALDPARARRVVQDWGKHVVDTHGAPTRDLLDMLSLKERDAVIAFAFAANGDRSFACDLVRARAGQDGTQAAVALEPRAAE